MTHNAGFNFQGAPRVRVCSLKRKGSRSCFFSRSAVSAKRCAAFTKEVERLGMRIRAHRSSAMTPLRWWLLEIEFLLYRVINDLNGP